MPDKIYEKGERVNTTLGPGKVLFKRMAGPDYTTVSCYSIALDHKVEESKKPPFPFYDGTIFTPDQLSDL